MPLYLQETDDKCDKENVRSYSYFFQIGSGKATTKKKFEKIRNDAEFRIPDNLPPLVVQVGPHIWLHGEKVIHKYLNFEPNQYLFFRS